MSDVPPPPGGNNLPPPPPAGAPAPPPGPAAPPAPPYVPPSAPTSSGGGKGPNKGLLIGIAAVVIVAIIAAVALVAGGGGDDDEASPSTTVKSSTTTVEAGGATTTAGDDDGGAITDVQDVKRATVQIVAQGSLRDPEVGEQSVAGSGSGFLIDPNGLIVTNNHVVTGAATLEVFVGGSKDGQNARVLGVSECNDLALIQLTSGKDYPYLEWYDGDIEAGLEVYAAGFPLGDPEFTLTKGIVAKAKAGGDLTGTSSIDHTIEHDANIQPGNSGGPLVNADGQVVGINYAGGDTRGTGTNQFFAIASDLAQPVVERLHDGDFESIGINGFAVVDEDAGLAGVWVSGVATGSPASETGVQAGDIVTTLQNLPVGRDGTFKDYCDVIRTAGDGAKMAIEVIRFDTSEVLKGELNGKELVQTFSFAQQLEDDVDDDGGTSTDYYTSYVPVKDDTGRLTVEVPSTWSSRQTAPESLDDGSSAPAIAASTDLNSYFNSYSVPGMQFVLFDGAASTDLNAVLDSIAVSDCTDGGRFDYSDPVFAGRYNVYTDCGGSGGATYVTLTATPLDGGDYLAVVAVQVLTDADLEALDHILDTFNVVG